MRALAVCVLLVFVALAQADTPAQCLFPDFEGTWKYYLGSIEYSNSVDCSRSFSVVKTVEMNLMTPDVVLSGSSKGFWTRIYGQGAELVIDGLKYFAFSMYKTSSCSNNTCTYTSYCNETFNGWYHDTEGKHWGCFYALKTTPPQMPMYNTTGACNCSAATSSEHRGLPPSRIEVGNSNIDSRRWMPETKLVKAINDAELTWTARVYPEYEQKTIRDMIRRAGGRKSVKVREELKSVMDKFVKPSRAHHVASVGALPIQWDWTNVSGVNFVSPVRDQADCGSCYAFGTTAALEARIRVMTKGQKQTILSPQNIVSCSQYSQGCDGGFPYLVGKYGEDFQQVTESCLPYSSAPENVACSARCNSTSQFVYDTNYFYVGGYFGACTAEAMMAELFYSGPIAVSFEVYPDFMHYSGGIYTHKNATAYANLQMNPFQVTNHAVNLVGYGVEDGVPFWKVKNSWGTSWGEGGFFRILRGVNECAIEEMAVAVTPFL